MVIKSCSFFLCNPFWNEIITLTIFNLLPTIFICEFNNLSLSYFVLSLSFGVQKKVTKEMHTSVTNYQLNNVLFTTAIK